MDGQDSEESRYRALRASDAFARVRDLDAQLRLSEPIETELLWHSPTASAYRVGADLQVLDRELRRAAALVRDWRTDRPLPRPVPAKEGGLEIESSSAGSFDAVLQAIGAVSVVLLSDPVQLLLTAQALISEPFSVKAWFKRRHDDPLEAPAVSLVLPGGAKATGRRIKLRRRYADGSEDLIVIE